jgi:hypothetical protein
MRKLLASVLCFTLTLSLVPANAMASGRGQISGLATIDGKPHAHINLRLRSLETGLLLGNTISNAEGRFSFTVPVSGSFVIESVTNNGTILGTSSVVSLKPSAMTSEVTVRSNVSIMNAGSALRAAQGQAAAGAGAGAGGGLSATAISLIAVGVGLGVTTAVVAARNDASPSQ